jgi:hypothetical protein
MADDGEGAAALGFLAMAGHAAGSAWTLIRYCSVVQQIPRRKRGAGE